MTGRHRMLDGDREVVVAVPVSGGENVMVPVIRAIVHPPGRPATVLLQRRDIEGERVRGRLEIPGGRWRSGEAPEAAIAREIAEETGLHVSKVIGVTSERFPDGRVVAALTPLVVASGATGAFPAAHVVVIVEADGAPRPEVGETADVRWWPMTEIVDLLDDDLDAFIPSSAVALRSYAAYLAANAVSRGE